MTQAQDHRVFLVSARKSDDSSREVGRKSKHIQRAARARSPIRLFFEDIVLLIWNLPLFRNLARPFRAPKSLPGVESHPWRVARGWIALILLSVLEAPLLVLALPAFILLPGWLFTAGSAGCLLVIVLIASTTWGSLVVKSKVDVDKAKFRGEKWFFINGITTSHATLQSDVDSLSSTFGRRVTGIHNRSFGIPFDLIECLIQRSFSYHTSDVRVATACLSLALEDPTVKKIVILAHSQGGLILSLVLDRLYAVLPAPLFAKLEIYTMGSAASFFHNPFVKHLSPNNAEVADTVKRLSKSATDPPSLITTAEEDAMTPQETLKPAIPNQLIHTIEHYVNGRDMVPRWGVLQHILLGTTIDYSGRVFVHQRASGHFFKEHYLDVMFPLADLQRIKDGDPHIFLNHRVHMENREPDGPKSKWWGIFRAYTDEIPGNDSHGAGPSRVPEQNLSVRDLSKLWRYMGGGEA